MARQIRINPNALRAAAKKQRDIAEQIHDAVSTLRSQSYRLNAAWEGIAGDLAVDALMEAAMNFAQISEAVQENTWKLESIAGCFENADDQAAASFRQADPAIINKVMRLVGQGRALPNLPIAAGDELSVIPDVLKMVASRCDDVADLLADISQHLGSSVRVLGSDWEGRAYDRYAEDTLTLAEVLRNQAAVLRSFAARISYSAHRYEEMDRALS